MRVHLHQMFILPDGHIGFWWVAKRYYYVQLFPLSSSHPEWRILVSLRHPTCFYSFCVSWSFFFFLFGYTYVSIPASFIFFIYIFHVTSLICSTDWWCLDIMCCSRCHSWLSFMTFFFLLFLLRFVFKLWWREGVGYVLFRRFECAVFRQNLRARWDSFESLTIEL